MRRPLLNENAIRYTIIARWDGLYWCGVFECLSNEPREIMTAAYAHFCAENKIEFNSSTALEGLEHPLEDNQEGFEPIVIFRGEIPMGADQIYWGDTGIVEHVAASVSEVMKGVA